MGYDTPTCIMTIIDTNEYAGSFERELCAFITGRIGDCGVGEEAAQLARKELPKNILRWFDANVDGWSDDRGCCRPVAIVPTPPGTKYKSVAISLMVKPPKYIRKIIKERAELFSTLNYKFGEVNSRFATKFKVIKVRYIDVKVSYDEIEI